MRGAFSARPDDPLRVDASALAAMDAATLASLFQVGTANPLLGLEGRAALLRRLGSALVAQRDAFGNNARPGALFDTLTVQGTRRAVSASTLLEAALSTACLSAMSGGIRMRAAAAPARAGSRCTSFRSGLPIRCSNLSSGRGSW